MFVNFWRAYRNFREVLQHFLNKEYPVDVTLRNGRRMTLHSEREIWYNMLSNNNLLNGKDYSVQFDEKEKDVARILRIKEKKKEVARIHYSINNGDIWGIFVKDEYRLLPVKNRVVLDIGANIGDSCIYFTLQGARNVIALEPFPKNYEMAKENIIENKLSDRIRIFLSGCGAKNQKIAIDSNHDSDMLSQLHPVENGAEIPLLSLKHLLDTNALTSEIVLKMDCEGCEYDSILSSHDDVLQRFKYIHIEYHYGYKSLKNKLVKSGFKVLVNRPTYWGLDKSGRPMYAGDILGINIDH